jgi:hypothetical protein
LVPLAKCGTTKPKQETNTEALKSRTVEGPGTTEGRAVASAALRHKDCRKGKLCLDKLVCGTTKPKQETNTEALKSRAAHAY